MVISTEPLELLFLILMAISSDRVIKKKICWKTPSSTSSCWYLAGLFCGGPRPRSQRLGSGYCPLSPSNSGGSGWWFVHHLHFHNTCSSVASCPQREHMEPLPCLIAPCHTRLCRRLGHFFRAVRGACQSTPSFRVWPFSLHARAFQRHWSQVCLSRRLSLWRLARSNRLKLSSPALQRVREDALQPSAFR